MAGELNLEAITAEWLNQCGPCDYGMPEYGCTHPGGDYRPVMLELVREVERLSEAMSSVWLHGNWRWLTGHMTAQEKTAAADAVDRAHMAIKDDDECAAIRADRWWLPGQAVGIAPCPDPDGHERANANNDEVIRLKAEGRWVS